MSQAITLTRYNATNLPIKLSLTPAINTEIITNTENYKVCLRSLEIPINTRFMPIDSSTASFNVIIFNEYKPEDVLIPGLDYGVNVFSFDGPIMSVDSFIKALNSIVEIKTNDFLLGHFDMDDDNKIFYSYDRRYADRYDMIKIYFDNKIQRLFPFDYDASDSITGYSRLMIEKSFVPETEVSPVKVFANSFSFPKFFTMKAIRVRTSLPIVAHLISSSSDRTLEPSNVLIDIKFNSMQMYNNDNLLFTPETLVYISMHNVNALRSFDLTFFYYYADGTEIPIELDSLDYASAFLMFEKI